MKRRIKDLRIKILERKRIDLLKRKWKAEDNKRKVLDLVNSKLFDLQEKTISIYAYNEQLDELLKGKSAKEWVDYYETYLLKVEQSIYECDKKIKLLQNRENRIKIAPYFLISMFVSFLLLLSINYFAKNSEHETDELLSLSPEEKITEIINLTFNSTTSYNLILENQDKLESLKVTGFASGSGNISLFFDDLKILNLTISNETVLFNDYCEETCNLSDYNLTKNNYILKIIIDGEIVLLIDSVSYVTSEEEIKIVPQKKEITPQREEFILKSGKRITSNEAKGTKFNLNIPQKWRIKDAQNVKVYWREGEKYIDFEALDLNADGVIDSLEIESPENGKQTYDIIVITKAEHLDENRTFISDIYNEVKDFDGIWSETINDGEYTRVTFEIKLDSTKDITIFPRIIHGNPRIEVYEKDKKYIIAEFNSIQNNSYNKVFLNNLENLQDTFDLKIINGAVEFDHILDPATPISYSSTSDGILAYIESGSQLPRYRWYNTSSNLFDSIESSAVSIGAAIEHIWVRCAPNRKECALLAADVNDDLKIQIYSRNSSGGLCWHNGTACGQVRTLETSLIAQNGEKAALEYENSSGDLLIIWGNTTEDGLKYAIWNGSAFSIEPIGAGALVTTGSVEWIETVQEPGTNNISIAYATSTDQAGIVMWNGNSNTFGCEKSSVFTGLTASNTPRIDIAHEQISGDLFAVFGISNNSEMFFATKPKGSCVYTQVSTSVLEDASDIVRAAPVWGTNRIVITNRANTADDNEFFQWDGTSIIDGAISDSNTALEASGNELLTGACVAGSNKCISPYADVLAEGGTNISWYSFIPSTNTWTLESDYLAGMSTTQEAMRCHPYPLGAYWNDKILCIFEDDNDDLWGFVYDDSLNSWNRTNSSSGALETSTSLAEYRSFSFDFLYSGFIQPIPDLSIPYTVLNSPSNNSDFLLGIFNITLNATVFDNTLNEVLEAKIYVRNASLINGFGNSLVYRNFFANSSSLSYNITSLPVIPDSTTKLLYHFDNRSEYKENDTYVYDYSGNGKNGSVNGSLVNLSGGKFAGGFEFNGINDSISHGTTAGVTNFPFTLSAWTRKKGNTSGVIVIFGGTAPAYHGIRINESGNAEILSSTDFSNDEISSGGFQDIRNGWHFIAGVFNNDTDKRLYVDGINVANLTAGRTFSGGFGGPTQIEVGKRLTLGYFNGTIDEVGIWNRSLNSSEIIDLYRLKEGKYYWKVNLTDAYGNSNESQLREFNIISSLVTSSPEVIFVSKVNDGISPIGFASPTMNSHTKVDFSFLAFDANGFADINDSTTIARFQKSGEQTRENSSCINLGNIDPFTKNYSCSIDMWYFDASGNWTINLTISDYSGSNATNSSTYFEYLVLSSFTVYPLSISFPTIFSSQINVLANDFLLINNTGNDERSVKIKAIDLLGLSDSLFTIPAVNFSTNIGNICGGNTLLNNTFVEVSGSFLSRGNNSLNYGNESSGQEKVYICLEHVPSGLKSQVYSSSSGGAWEISILLAAFSIGKKRRKNKLGVRKANEVKETNISQDSLLLARIEEKIGEIYTLLNESKKTLPKEISNVENIKVPIEVFSYEFGAAESLTKYLKENEKLKIVQISRLINRDRRTVGANYSNSRVKFKQAIDIKNNDQSVPLVIFTNRKLSILESLVLYLREKEMKNIEIAKLLNKDPRNIWTIYSRAVRKKN